VYGEISRGPAALVGRQGRRAEGFTHDRGEVVLGRDRLERCTVAQKDGAVVDVGAVGN